MAHRAMDALKDGEYEVCIDSSLKEGSLTYGEFRLQGRTDEEVLISAHACHPSLANDNLSGMAVAAFAARRLKALADAGKPPRYSYRFLFAPVTIGAIAWMSRNRDVLPRVRHGLVLSLLGDAGPFTYKRSRRGDAAVDRAAAHALAWSGAHHQVIGFSPYGYDERQFCSPGADLPVGCLMRTPFGRFPEYHTSADNLDFVKPESLAGSLRAVLSILDVLENDGAYVNTSPMGEPQLSRRGLFQARDGRPGPDLMALLWVLNQGDGSRSLLEIAEAANLGFAAVKHAAGALLGCGLLQEKEIPP
jgi:aminopeptidase-like protein